MSLIDKIAGNKYVRHIAKGSFIASAPWLLSNHVYRPFEICYYTGNIGVVTGCSLLLNGILDSVGKDRFIGKYAPEISVATLTAGITLTELVNTSFNVPDPKDIPATLIGGAIAYIWTKGDKIAKIHKDNIEYNPDLIK
jgi:hypothetical protein